MSTNAVSHRARVAVVAAVAISAISSTASAAPASDIEGLAWQAAVEANVAVGYRAYLAEYPKGRFAGAARIKLTALPEGGGGSAPVSATSPALSKSESSAPAAPPAAQRFVRPTLPFSVPDEVWQTIENSEMVRHLPAAKPVSVSYTLTTQTDLASLKHVRTRSLVTTKTGPLAGASRGVTEMVYSVDTTSNVESSPPTSTATRSFTVGPFTLGSVLDGKAVGVIQRIHEVSGSLFPLRSGNRLRFRYDTGAFKISNECEVGESKAASSIRPDLPGNAWRIRCRATINSAAPVSSESWFVEDLGLSDLSLAVPDYTRPGAPVVPQADRHEFKFGNTVHVYEDFRIVRGH